MGKRPGFDDSKKCPRCRMRREYCICAFIQPVETQAKFVIIRHYVERNRPTNSGRVAGLAMPNSRIIDYGLPDERFDPATLDVEDTWLLFPTQTPTPLPIVPPPKQVVVVDGSWSQARRMVQRIEKLRTMPRLSLPPPTHEVWRMRKEHLEEGMATLEAIARTVEVLEGAEKAAPLHKLFEAMVSMSLSGRFGAAAAPKIGE